MVQTTKYSCFNLMARITYTIGSNHCHTNLKAQSLNGLKSNVVIAVKPNNFVSFECMVITFRWVKWKFASFEFPPTLLRSTQDGRWPKFYLRLGQKEFRIQMLAISIWLYCGIKHNVSTWQYFEPQLMQHHCCSWMLKHISESIFSM